MLMRYKGETAMYSLSIFMRKLLTAHTKLNLETTVCKAGGLASFRGHGWPFESVRFFLVERS